VEERVSFSLPDCSIRTHVADFDTIIYCELETDSTSLFAEKKILCGRTHSLAWDEFLQGSKPRLWQRQTYQFPECESMPMPLHGGPYQELEPAGYNCEARLGLHKIIGCPHSPPLVQ
jgi:hypothetical protein